MNILYGILLGILFYPVGWVIIEIPFSLAHSFYNYRRFGTKEVKPAGMLYIGFVVFIQVVVLSVISYSIGIPREIVSIAATTRFIIMIFFG
jgi:hypothetical protein